MPPPQVAKMLARTLGILLIVLALVGFIPNPLIGAAGYFRTDTILNAVLAGIGILLLTFTTKGEGTAASGLFFGAMLAFGFAAIGYMQMSEQTSSDAKLFDLIACNLESIYLFGGMSVVMGISGMMNTSSRQVIRD